LSEGAISAPDFTFPFDTSKAPPFERSQALNFGQKKDPPGNTGGSRKAINRRAANAAPLLLPSTLLVAIRLQALTALVFIHLQTTFLFQIAHGGLFGERSTCVAAGAL